MSEEVLQIAVKKVKGKGEKERYTHLNAEFQRIARRDEKGFLGDQCKEMEEKEILHAKMDTKKDRNGMDQRKQKILGRVGKNTLKYTKEIFMTQITTMVWSLT